MNRALRLKPQIAPDLWINDMLTLGRWKSVPSMHKKFFLPPIPVDFRQEYPSLEQAKAAASRSGPNKWAHHL